MSSMQCCAACVGSRVCGCVDGRQASSNGTSVRGKEGVWGREYALGILGVLDYSILILASAKVMKGVVVRSVVVQGFT